MRVAVVGNCQVHGIGDGLKHLFDSATVLALEGPALKNANALDASAKALDGFDIVFDHMLPDEFGPLSGSALRARFSNVITLPGISFTGFHPDCVYLVCGERAYLSPLGPYNSAIAAASFSLGYPVERALALFNAFIYRKLGYFDEFGKSEFFLRRAMTENGMDIADEWPHWLAKGPFMNTVNHPRPNVLASVAKLASKKAGILPKKAATPELYHDWLAALPIWPVYPELARELGVAGGYLFKRGETDRMTEYGLFLNLRDFVAGSYALYEGYPEEVFDLDAVARVRAVLVELK